MSHPWTDVIPPADIESFAGGQSTVDRELEAGARPALVVVDMTYGFVDSRYPTGWSPGGEPAVAANARLLDEARRAGIPVVFTKMFADPAHAPTAGEVGRWKPSQRAPVPEGLPPGDVIVPAIQPRPGELVVHKGYKPSGFFGTQLASWLIHEHVDTVIITGMSTSGCVRATALDAFQHNFYVIIPHEACADRSQISHKVSLFDLHMKYADVVSVERAVRYLADVAAHRAQRS
jgi:maleamate amidohydrolase